MADVVLVCSKRYAQSASSWLQLVSVRYNEFGRHSMGVGRFQSGIVWSTSVVLRATIKWSNKLRTVVLFVPKWSGRCTSRYSVEI
jgi:hypothetical protein